MGPKLRLMLLLMELAATVTFGKYVYVPTGLSWSEAQSHCQAIYTDLAPVNSEYDIGLMKKMDLPQTWASWIGLINTTNSSTGWMWSGGGEVSTFFWGTIEPNNHLNAEDHGAVQHPLFYWMDLPLEFSLGFFCYKVHAIRKRMTWDDALQYCRKNHKDLVSVASETEMMLIEKELRKDFSSFYIWIGLQFLEGRWQWMDGQPYRYKSWEKKEPVCPDFSFACGALLVVGQRQNIVTDILTSVDRVTGWHALDCTLKRHFLCY